MRKSRTAATALAALLFITACTASPKTNSAPVAPPPPQPGPTGFITSDLILPTLEASTGDATISVTLTNTGAAEATHELKLVIDKEVISTKSVTLAGNSSQKVSFEIILDHAGTLNVTIDQVSGKLRWAGPN